MKVTADQMREQIANVRDCMNSVKSCAEGDNKVAEKKHLASAVAELAVMTLARKNAQLVARQEAMLEEARELLATSSDEGSKLPDPPIEGVELVKKLSGRPWGSGSHLIDPNASSQRRRD